MADVTVDPRRDEVPCFLPFIAGQCLGRRTEASLAARKDETPDDQDQRHGQEGPRGELSDFNRIIKPVGNVEDDECKDGFEGEEA